MEVVAGGGDGTLRVLSGDIYGHTVRLTAFDSGAGLGLADVGRYRLVATNFTHSETVLAEVVTLVSSLDFIRLERSDAVLSFELG